MSKQEKIHKLEPLTFDTIYDCLEIIPRPKTHDVRVDLYWCARGICRNCSRKKTRGRTEVGDCRHDLLDDANDLLAPYDK